MRNRRALLLAGVLSVLTADIGLSAEKKSTSKAETFDIRLTKTKGEVWVQAAGDESEIPAASGMPLEIGDRLRTGASASAEVGFHGGESLISIRSNTFFQIKSVTGKKIFFRLAEGRIFAHIRKSRAKKSPITIRTPTAVVKVRGTQFGVEIVGEGKNIETYVGVFDSGKVEVGQAGGGPTELLIANQETRVRYGRGPSIPYQLERLAKYRRHVRGLKGKARKIRKKWKSLSPAKRSKLRLKVLEMGRKRLEKKLKRRTDKGKERVKEDKAVRKNLEAMEERRRRIRRKRRRGER